jgi:ketosteroid isomerase-like protein
MTGQVNTKAQQLSRIRNHNFVLTRLDLNEMKIKLLGQVAIVTVRASVDGSNDGIPMSGTFRYTRIYQQMPNGVWKITNFEATRMPGIHGEQRADAAIQRQPG